jgi:hypothetical protein
VERSNPATNEPYRPWKDNNASKFWKNMIKIKDIFNCSISFQIGNGKSILFWQDNWMGDSLQKRYLALFMDATRTDCTIHEINEEDT